MAPKTHRSGSSSRLAGRTASATKITSNNLQFTQKDNPAPSKHSDKQKKATGHGHDNYGKAPGFGRVNSSQRIQSREQIQPLKRGLPSQKVNSTKAKAAFTISNAKGDEDDEDEWVSSESGAATPNHHESDSETASESESSKHALYTNQYNGRERERSSNTLPRVDTLRANDFSRVDTVRPNEFAPSTLKNESNISPEQPDTPTYAPQPLPPAPAANDIHLDLNNLQSQLRRLELESTKETRTDSSPQIQPSPRPSHSKRPSRPSSTYSVTKPELRPHPLIRGQSFGHVLPAKPIVLAPLTTGTAPPQLSTSPTSSVPGSASPTSPFPSSERRHSVSSSRSVATVPAAPTFRSEPPRPFDRTRTLSTMTTTSSSAALSALTHLPAVTRPPSPQSVLFFPPVNPHANPDAIHPLLPAPYLTNHLALLTRRHPLRDSYDRVIRAKQAL